MAFGDLGDDGVRLQRSIGGAERGIGGEVNTLGGAEIEKLRLGEIGWIRGHRRDEVNRANVNRQQKIGGGVLTMQLDLVNGRHNGGISKQALKVECGEVGHTNGLGLPCSQKLFHSPVCLGEVAVEFGVEVAPAVGVARDQGTQAGGQSSGPMQKVEIDVVQAKVGEGLVEPCGDKAGSGVGCPKLGGDKELGARNARITDRGADLLFVAVLWKLGEKRLRQKGSDAPYREYVLLKNMNGSTVSHSVIHCLL